MRRLEFLINKVRRNTNNLQDTRFPDEALIDLFNDAQREIQRIAVTAHDNSGLFSDQHLMDLIAGQDEYDLPDDIFSINSVNSVGRRYSGDGWYTPIRKTTQKERGSAIGYILLGPKIIISPYPQTTLESGIRLTYTYKIPTLSKRYGSVTATTANTISIPPASEDPSIIDGYISVVDSNGNILQSGLEVVSYTAGVLSVNGVVDPAVLVGSYVCAGAKATTNSELPDTCEYVLTSIVERCIYMNDSSADFVPSDAITSKLRSRIETLFADNNRDVDYPEIVDDTYLN